MRRAKGRDWWQIEFGIVAGVLAVLFGWWMKIHPTFLGDSPAWVCPIFSFFGCAVLFTGVVGGPLAIGMLIQGFHLEFARRAV